MHYVQDDGWISWSRIENLSYSTALECNAFDSATDLKRKFSTFRYQDRVKICSKPKRFDSESRNML